MKSSRIHTYYRISANKKFYLNFFSFSDNMSSDFRVEAYGHHNHNGILYRHEDLDLREQQDYYSTASGILRFACP
jgi:hypothetical protein